MAIGGVFLGIYALGGLAIAKNIAFGDYASGHIAIGNHVKGTVEFLYTNAVLSSEIKKTILEYIPHTWDIIVSVFSNISL